MTVLKNAMDSIKDKIGFLIDGFPRDLGQGEVFRTQVSHNIPASDLLILTHTHTRTGG